MVKDKEFIKWSEVISIGIPSVDDQHKVLVDIVNSLFSQILEPRPGVHAKDFFLRLKLYTKEHFEYEEFLLKKFNWSEYNKHKNEHEVLIKRLDALEKEFSACDDLGALLEVMEFLKEWLQNHILKEDKEFASFLKAKGVD